MEMSGGARARSEVSRAMRFEFHPEALAEYEDAARYYAGCQNGLELRFIAAVEHAIQQIVGAPDRWPVRDGV